MACVFFRPVALKANGLKASFALNADTRMPIGSIVTNCINVRVAVIKCP